MAFFRQILKEWDENNSKMQYSAFAKTVVSLCHELRVYYLNNICLKHNKKILHINRLIIQVA
jgi:hypothetical protein